MSLYRIQNPKHEPRYRIPIGTKVQSCHCCGHPLKKEPFVRMDCAIRSWGGQNSSVNICYRCVDAQSKSLKKELKKPKVMAELFCDKLE